ncbi:MAG: hypothetical protein KKE73_10870 [Proteobacteria bacterium]|nr:hypothetical protein [Pseudomonadota bacterium]
MIGTALAALASAAAPALGRLFAGDRGAAIGEGVASIATSLTGHNDQDAAAEALAKDPKALLEFNAQVLDLAMRELEEDTKRLQIVNQTVLAELRLGENAKNGWEFFLAIWKSGWRPFWGWVSGAAFGVQIFGNMLILGMTLLDPHDSVQSKIPDLAALNYSLTGIWLMAMAVLGVAVHKRSKDKELTAGIASGGLDLSGAKAALSGIMSTLGGKGR